jgi:hypothetical protein
MNNLWSALPTGSAAVVFGSCIAIGIFVLFKFCLDQFEKPSRNTSDADPWKFVDPRYLTTPRQYVVGFAIYFGTLTMIFLVASFIGPDLISQIGSTFGLGSGQATGGRLSSTGGNSLQAYPTFPIIVAFVMVGLNPNLKLPKILDFEALVRQFAHRSAYIPRNMSNMFDFMRISKFTVSDLEIGEAWKAVGLQRPDFKQPTLARVATSLDRGVVLYSRAAELAGDPSGVTFPHDGLNLGVFRRYRSQLDHVLVNLQGAHVKVSRARNEAAALQKLERDIITNLEFLYVIFACAVTTKGTDKASTQLKALGFQSDFINAPGIPWDPVLKAALAITGVLVLAALVAQWSFPETIRDANIPPGPLAVLWLIASITCVHSAAVAFATHLRTRLIVREKYFLVETGKINVIALIKVFFAVGALSLVIYLIWNGTELGERLEFAGGGGLSVAAICRNYFYNYLIWSLLPACCGVLTAITIDRSSNSVLERTLSGAMEGGIMGVAGLLAVNIINSVPSLAGDPNHNYIPFYIFVFTLYGGVGFVFGYVLPEGAKRYWQALEQGLPDRINVLRTAVSQYFHDVRQFQEWLNTRNKALEGRRPLDLLAEDTGVQRLVAFVSETRKHVAAAA